MNYFFIVSQQILILIIYALAGIIAVKTKIFHEDSLTVLSKFIMKLAMPLLIFTGTINGTTKKEFMECLPLLAGAVFMYFVLFFLCFGLKRLFRVSGDRGNIYHAASMFGNIGFMGIPILSAMFPEKGMLYIALFTIIDQLTLWTLGIHLTTPQHKKTNNSPRQMLLHMISPATVGLALAVLLLFLQIQIPGLLNSALTKIGSTTTPLAMIYLGAFFCYIPLFKYLRHLEFYGTILLKMVLFPIALYYTLGFFPAMQGDIQLAIGVLSSMPAMTSIIMFASSQGSDGDYAGGQVFVTTLASILTIPLVCFVLG